MHYKKCFILGFIFTVMFCNINAMDHKRKENENSVLDIVDKRQKKEKENLVAKGFSNKRLINMFQWDPKVNIEFNGEDPYNALFSRKNIKSLEYLLSKGLDVNKSESLPLFKAINSGDPEVVRCVLGCKEIKIDIESEDGKNCLIKAIELLNKGKDEISYTRIFDDVGVASIINLLLSHKDSSLLINKKSGNYHKTALSILVDVILSYKKLSLKNFFTISHGTPSFRNTLRDLLEHGENPYLKNGKGKSALDTINDHNLKATSNSKIMPIHGLADYMEHKYEEFKTNRKNHLIGFTAKLLSQGEQLDPERPCYLFPKPLAQQIAIECYKDE